VSDFNMNVIEEFRANEGRVGGPFAGAPIVLIHHVGRRSGKDYVSPTMYLADEADPDVIYVFASKGGAPTHPEWFHNLLAAGHATVEVGTDAYPVTVTEVTGEERDRIFAEQAGRYPGFAGYERRTAGVRIIPVVKLARS
jgi:deazaflavin-dependent oxidoreductase (nitroreductase family)